MTGEQIANILSGTQSSQPEFFKKIGVSNVHQRIQYTFGPEYGIYFTSIPNSYTTVTITFPYNFTLSHS